jgi:hypothetical protein
VFDLAGSLTDHGSERGQSAICVSLRPCAATKYKPRSSRQTSDEGSAHEKTAVSRSFPRSTKESHINLFTLLSIRLRNIINPLCNLQTERFSYLAQSDAAAWETPHSQVSLPQQQFQQPFNLSTRFRSFPRTHRNSIFQLEGTSTHTPVSTCLLLPTSF